MDSMGDRMDLVEARMALVVRMDSMDEHMDLVEADILAEVAGILVDVHMDLMGDRMDLAVVEELVRMD